MRTTEKDLLLEGRWHPVTACVVFIRASLERAVDELANGIHGNYVKENLGAHLMRSDVSGSLEKLLSTLLPLEVEGRHFLFTHTGNPNWTAMFDSSARGMDPTSPLLWFSAGGLEVLAFDCKLKRSRTADRLGSHGIRRIQMFAVSPSGEPSRHLLGVRGAGSGWVELTGTAELPTGNVWAPDASRVGDRFTLEHMRETAARLGLAPFDEHFYAPDGRGVLVQRSGEADPSEPRFTLAQARGEEPSLLRPVISDFGQ